MKVYKQKSLCVLLFYTSLALFPASAGAQTVFSDTAKVIVAKGWNLVSLPLQPSTFDKQSLFPSATSMAFKYDGGYDTTSTLEAGVGYWMKFAAPETIQIVGCRSCSPFLKFGSGWNLVGSFAKPALVESLLMRPTSNVVQKNFYAYRYGYMTVDTLDPGAGYWVKSTAPGVLVVDDGFKPAYTADDTAEAIDFALWLSGKLRAPDSLVSATLFNLGYLRHVVQNPVLSPVVNAKRFMLPWYVSRIDIKFDDTTAQKVSAGQYDAWNQFEESLRPVLVGTVNRFGWSILRFAGILHPRRLSDMYRNLPGVLWTEQGGPGFCEACGCPDFPTYPRLVGDDLTYAFTGGVQCSSRWRYFKTLFGVPQYVNSRWWDEAGLNMLNFSSWDGPP